MKYLFSSLLLISFIVGLYPNTLLAASIEEQEAFAERVNLALRQVGHQLLILNGNETSAIPPVEEITPTYFKLLMQDSFAYDTLPFLLDQAFTSFNIDKPYYVSVERCEDELLILGYNEEAFVQGNISCRGREQTSDCNNIRVRFEEPSIVEVNAVLGQHSGDRNPTKKNNMILLTFVAVFCLALVGFLFRRRQKVNASSIDQNEERTITSEKQTVIALGKFSFDNQNQTLQLGNEKQDLTFRESKLLYHLVQHINEVQTRDSLIENVWSDEGVIVGRSLDVFISRLRKHLKADENVAIKNIHGVGYRLELAS